MTEIFTAKTVSEAKALAVKKFGKKESEIKFEVIEEGKKGFLGLGQVNSKVKATYIEEIAKSAPAVEEAPKKPAEKDEKKAPVKETVKKENVKEEEKKENEVNKEAEVKENIASEKTAEQESAQDENTAENNEINDDMDFCLDNFTRIEDESLIAPKVKIACDYIKSIFNAMEIEAKFVIYQNGKNAVIDIESNNNGTIIGRRGETLDSLQYLCSIIANKGDNDYYRITIDCLGYRKKRMETLRQLAGKVARSVIRTGRSQTLEPMNPYERRIIHSAISEIEGVDSRSVGEEPYRKIVITSTNPKRNYRRNGRRDDRNGRYNRDRKHENFESKEIDVSTSFEKDYKKPKPEDSMEGGLYGKIEF